VPSGFVNPWPVLIAVGARTGCSKACSQSVQHSWSERFPGSLDQKQCPSKREQGDG
jgi:hypothetical protein